MTTAVSVSTLPAPHPHFDTTAPNSPQEMQDDIVRYEQSLLKELKQNPTDLISLGGLANFLTNFPDRYQESLGHFEKLVNEYYPQSEDSKLESHLILPLSTYLAIYASKVEGTKKDLAMSLLKRALSIHPTNPLAMGNYACFLHKTCKKYKEAQEAYLSSLETHPDHASIHVKYANFLKSVKRDNEVAAKHFKKAVRLSPKNADVLSSFAVFLHANVSDVKNAEVMYQRAFESDPTHVNNLSNYGLFLSEMKGEFSTAEKMYLLAMEVDPNHGNSIYNYAVMLDR